MSQRFSDAELAAEWHRAANDWNAELYGFPTGDEERWRRGNNHEERFDNADERLDIIERFATLPHAHETNLVNENTKKKR